MNSTTATPDAAMAFPPVLLAILQPLALLLTQFAQTLHAFSTQTPTPQATHQLELDLRQATQELARTALENAFNAVEPANADAPDNLRVDGLRFRRRDKTPQFVDSLFGQLRIQRCLYESRDGGPCFFPLRHLLGLVADRVTPALASRVGRLVADATQREALAVLEGDHGIHWSVETLRKVGSAVADVVGPLRQAAQAEQVIDWLRQAWRRKGKRPPVLAVGRDGITLNTGGEHFEVLGVGTLSVYDRQGQRLGTVYLGFMPEKEQAELSRQLTGLLQEVLKGWKGRRPRLAYVADGGSVETSYYQEQLRGMKHPVTQEELKWVRVVDYYHAAGYVSKLAEALFGKDWQGLRWAQRMRGVLKQAGGVTRVLQSASALKNRRKLTAERSEEFRKAHQYLQRRVGQMDYARYRSEGIPIGSGVTEAGCKLVVTQRLKRSGMEWNSAGGQVVLDLRCVKLSRIWDQVWNAHLAEGIKVNLPTYDASLPANRAVAA